MWGRAISPVHSYSSLNRLKRPEFLSKPSQRPQQLLDIRQLVNRIDLGEGDLSILIDDKRGALTDARHRRPLAENAELARHFGMGIEIGAERNLDRADFFPPPGNVAGDGVYADVQNLGIEGLELLATGVEFGHLPGSSRSPVEGMEGDDQIPGAEIVTRAYRNLAFTGNCGEFEIGRPIADLQRHIVLQSDQNCN